MEKGCTLRKVICKKKFLVGEPPNRRWEEYELLGVFHEWGVDYEEFDTGPGNFSVGIVELTDGRVEGFRPELIRFIGDENEELCGKE